MKAGAKFGIEAAETITNNAGTTFGLTAGENISIHAATDFYAYAGGNTHVNAGGSVYSTAGSDNHIRAGGNINVDGTQFRGQEGAAGSATVAPAVESNVVQLTAPDFTEGKQNQFPYLSTPVRPSPPLQLKYAIAEENEALVADYTANPDKYYNKDAAADGVKPNYAGTPKDDGQGKSLIAGSATSDIAAFLEKQLQLTAQSGYWRETGQGGAPSNVNITRIWADLGYPKQGMWLSDQTAWCMGFINWTLKQCGYRYVQTAGAKQIAATPEKWGAKQVSIEQAEPGDIVLWNYSHVNFVYRNTGGKLSFVGGNQSPAKGGNNPNDGDITIAWPFGWNSSRGGIVGIFRPSKT
jgi:hypothetical protein